MTLISTKEQLIRLLEDQDNKVIALSGKWGTGKSHMWGEVKKASQDKQTQGALYASLFGLSSIDQVKMRLIQNAVPMTEDHAGITEAAKKTLGAALEALKSVHPWLSRLKDAGLLIVPVLLRQRLIVLDDIERKHEGLQVHELLGFIDEFTQQYGARFVLILNSDQLADRELWNTLREKVVDQELRLNTSPREAFGIASQLTSTAQSGAILDAIERCGVTNIRIVRKVIKATNQILSGRKGLSDAVLARVIPSIVLLASIHYKGIEDGPDFDFVLAQGGVRDWGLLARKENADSPESKRKSNWKLLISSLGIMGCDRFEVLVVEFLESGLFDASEIGKILDTYILEEEAMKARNDLHCFFDQLRWEHTLSEEDLLAEAGKLAPRVELLDAYSVTTLYGALEGLTGGKALGDSIVDLWVNGIRAKDLKMISDDRQFWGRLHPRISELFDEINGKAQSKLNAYDVCVHITKNEGWGATQRAAMQSATEQDMERIIRSTSGGDLRLFMGRMMEFSLQKESYEREFGEAMNHFLEACRAIARDSSSPRLSKLIQRLFEEAGRLELLGLEKPPKLGPKVKTKKQGSEKSIR